MSLAGFKPQLRWSSATCCVSFEYGTRCAFLCQHLPGEELGWCIVKYGWWMAGCGASEGPADQQSLLSDQLQPQQLRSSAALMAWHIAHRVLPESPISLMKPLHHAVTMAKNHGFYLQASFFGWAYFEPMKAMWTIWLVPTRSPGTSRGQSN